MGTTDNPKTPIIAYKIKLADEDGNWLALSPLQEALDWLKEELEIGDGQYSYTIEPWETTQEELDSLPEFQGF